MKKLVIIRLFDVKNCIFEYNFNTLEYDRHGFFSGDWPQLGGPYPWA